MCVCADVHVVSCTCITSSAVQEDLMENALSIIFPFICALYVLPQATLPYYAAIVIECVRGKYMYNCGVSVFRDIL